MSNTETVTLEQFLQQEEAQAELGEAQAKIRRIAFEQNLVDTFLKRVTSGEFEDEAAARKVSDLVFAKALDSTKAAFEARLVDFGDWAQAHQEYKNRLAAADTLEKDWAQARADLQRKMGGTYKGNGFQRTVSLTVNKDGSATIPAEVVDILIEASKWVNLGKVQKVSGFLNATASGALELEVKVNNPSKA